MINSQFFKEMIFEHKKYDFDLNKFYPWIELKCYKIRRKSNGHIICLFLKNKK
jgi:hypothetical protein